MNKTTTETQTAHAATLVARAVAVRRSISTTLRGNDFRVASKAAEHASLAALSALPVEVPTLTIDGARGPLSGEGRLSPRLRRERRIFATLCVWLATQGWSPAFVFDGESNADGQVPVVGVETAMEVVFGLDDSTVTFEKLDPAFKSGQDVRRHGVKIVLGNDTEIVADWTFDGGDADGFDALMSAFPDPDLWI